MGLELCELRSNRDMISPSIVGWFYQPSIVAEQPVVQVFRAAPRYGLLMSCGWKSALMEFDRHPNG